MEFPWILQVKKYQNIWDSVQIFSEIWTKVFRLGSVHHPILRLSYMDEATDLQAKLTSSIDILKHHPQLHWHFSAIFMTLFESFQIEIVFINCCKNASFCNVERKVKIIKNIISLRIIDIYSHLHFFEGEVFGKKDEKILTFFSLLVFIDLLVLYSMSFPHQY